MSDQRYYATKTARETGQKVFARLPVYFFEGVKFLVSFMKEMWKMISGK